MEESNEPAYEWLYRDQNGCWVKYGSTKKDIISSEELETWFQQDSDNPFHINHRGSRYVIDFHDKSQENKNTGHKIPIRRATVNHMTASERQSNQKRTSESSYFGNGISGESPVNSNAMNDKFQWYFLDDNKSWVRFGDTNSGYSSHATNLTSDDIEKHYLQNPNKPLDIENQHNKYILNFQSMTQINKQTKVARAVWRTTATNAQPNSKKPTSHQSAFSGSKYAWYFQNDKNDWTKFGDSSSGYSSFATNLSSDDIEKHYLQNPTTPLHVENQFNKYVLDLVKMTQTNIKTNVVRNVLRSNTDIANPSVSPTFHAGSTSDDEEYEWFFQDDKNNWTKFGESSSGDRSHATNLTSRDIEKHYQSNKFKYLDIENQYNKYVLDLVKMTQTNIRTRVVRRLKRTTARNKDSGSSGQGATGVDHNDMKQKQSMTSRLYNAVAGAWKPQISGSTNAEYEWFFMDDLDNWIKYDISYTSYGGYTIKTTSQDIEKAFQSDQRKLFHIKTNTNSYVLDFINMTQTNKQTNKVRAISRVLQNTSLIKKKTAANSNQASSSAQPNLKPAQYEWFFMDDQNTWVKYNISTIDTSGNVISITSKDIEKAFQTNQKKPFYIDTYSNSYVLDFKSMTQTNKKTNKVRPISRVLHNTSLIKK